MTANRPKRGLGKNLDPDTRSALKQAILRKPLSGKTVDQICRELGVSRSTYAAHKTQLTKDAAAARDDSTLAALTPRGLADDMLDLGGEIPDDVHAERLKAALGRYPILTAPEQMAALSQIAQTSEDQRTVVAAHNLLNTFRAQHAPAESAGPPDPLTTPERHARLKRIMEACGPELCLAVTHDLWPQPGESAPPSNPSDTVGTGPSPIETDTL